MADFYKSTKSMLYLLKPNWCYKKFKTMTYTGNILSSPGRPFLDDSLSSSIDQVSQ